MSKRLKERVQTGVDDQQKPVYKWAAGYSAAELQEVTEAAMMDSINYGEYTKEKNLAISKVDFNCNGSDIDNTYATIKLSMTTDYSNEDFGLNLIIPIGRISDVLD